MELLVLRTEADGASARGWPPVPGVVWAQFGDELVLCGAGPEWRPLRESLAQRATRTTEAAGLSRDRLHVVVQTGRLFEVHHPEVRVLHDRGRYLLVDLDPKQARRIGKRHPTCYGLHPLAAGEVVFARGGGVARRDPAPLVKALVHRVSGERLHADLSRLVAMHTRHSTSNEYRDAVVELGEKLRELGYIVHKQRIRVGAGFSYNLIADRRGSDAGSRGQVVVTAHLDSINGEDVASAAAPGADDNASGSAGILEMARVFSGTTAKRDLRFVLFGGEEQGLFGSKHLVGKLTTAERNRIHAVINMDMIASTNTPERTVLLEGAAVSSNAMDELEAAAVTYTSLRIERSLHASSSDHVPFIEWGIPGVLTIEGADSTNQRVHTVRDRPEHLDLELAVEIVRMNVAFVAATIGVSATAGPEQRLPACARAWPVRDARAALRE